MSRPYRVLSNNVLAHQINEEQAVMSRPYQVLQY